MTENDLRLRLLHHCPREKAVAVVDVRRVVPAGIDVGASPDAPHDTGVHKACEVAI
jgi:hypothetical protein